MKARITLGITSLALVIATTVPVVASAAIKYKGVRW